MPSMRRWKKQIEAAIEAFSYDDVLAEAVDKQAAKQAVADLAAWDMLTLDADGKGVATADAPWAHRQLAIIRKGLGA